MRPGPTPTRPQTDPAPPGPQAGEERGRGRAGARQACVQAPSALQHPEAFWREVLGWPKFQTWRGSPVRWGRGLGWGSGERTGIRREGSSTRSDRAQRGVGSMHPQGLRLPGRSRVRGILEGLGGGAQGQHWRAAVSAGLPPAGRGRPRRQGGREGSVAVCTHAPAWPPAAGQDRPVNPAYPSAPPACFLLPPFPSGRPGTGGFPGRRPHCRLCLYRAFGSTFFPGFLPGFFLVTRRGEGGKRGSLRSAAKSGKARDYARPLDAQRRTPAL